MKEFCERIKHILLNNKKVFENYFFMTVLQILNSLFYLLIYPYLIRTLGAEGYGLYVFAYSIVTFFIIFVSFGFDMPSVKAIAQNVDDKLKKENVLSCVFTAKIYLELISIVVFSVVVFAIPALRANWQVFFICFTITISNILFPQWYFQGVQRMRVVTYIQLGFKLLSLPFVFWLVKTTNDVWVFTLIAALTSVLGGFSAMFIIRFKDGLKIHWKKYSELKIWIKDAFPFFLSSSTGVLKEQGLAVIIGAFLGMRDIAIYDLANKIIIVPRTVFASINGAIFPKIIANIQNKVIKKIIAVEALVSVFVIICIAIFGKWVVLKMGGQEMLDSYPVAIILSFTVIAWLLVGAYTYFVFVPQNKYYYVSRNQLLAMISFFIYVFVGFIFVQNIYVLSAAMALSGITEVVYCNVLIRKNKMLR